MTDIAIKVEGLSKLYRIGAKQARYKTLRESIMSTLKNSIKSITSNRPDRLVPQLWSDVPSALTFQL